MNTRKDVLVIVFTCNHCPIATAYEDRIIQFTKDFGNRADVVAINVNTDDLDRLPQMKERAAEKHFNFPYLYDETQAIAHSLAAYVTPHFFVFNRERKLVYKGAMDDDLSVEDVKATYLADAVNAVVAGKRRPLPSPWRKVAKSTTAASSPTRQNEGKPAVGRKACYARSIFS